jgi:hypothetical protein
MTVIPRDLGSDLLLVMVRDRTVGIYEVGLRVVTGRARAELSQYVIKLQHTIITMMTESNVSGTITMPSLPIMLSTSEDTRAGVVVALGEQYQKMSQAVPLSRTILSSGEVSNTMDNTSSSSSSVGASVTHPQTTGGPTPCTGSLK